jgi:hypothetical protein
MLINSSPRLKSGDASVIRHSLGIAHFLIQPESNQSYG